jgi:hypothetical protein
MLPAAATPGIALALCPLGLPHRLAERGPVAVLAENIALIEACCALAEAQGARRARVGAEHALWVLPPERAAEAIVLAADLCALAAARRATTGGPRVGLGLAAGALAEGPEPFGAPTLQALQLAGPANRGDELLAAGGPDSPWMAPPPGVGASPLRADRTATLGFAAVLLRDHRGD